MTQEEIQEFKETIAKTIMPLAINMTKEQIKIIIDNVTKDNSELPKGFGNMIYEQIMIMKYNGRIS